MAEYSKILGVWKSVKNTIIVLVPALAAGWLAFTQNVPAEIYGLPTQPIIMAVGGFLTYMLKNYIQVTRE